MTDLPSPVERELDAHAAFERDEDGYALRTTVFDTTVTADEVEGDRDGAFRATVSVPTLDAAVTGESVADVVEEGWFETFERRLADAFGLAHTSAHEEPVLERDDREIRVILEYVARDAGEGVEDAKTLIEYVEGTYAQGLVPGYEYRGPAAELLTRAQRQGQRAADGEGTPL